MKLVIQDENACKVMPCKDYAEASCMRDACRTAIQIALKGAAYEIYDSKKKAFIIKGKDVYVELIIE